MVHVKPVAELIPINSFALYGMQRTEFSVSEALPLLVNISTGKNNCNKQYVQECVDKI